LEALGPHTKPIGKFPKEWESNVSYYTGILKFIPEDYEKKMNAINLDDLISENIRQSYITAGIISYKVANLKKAIKLLPAVLLIIAILVGFILYWLF
jgi:preprotein translocase subunit Sec61beta